MWKCEDQFGLRKQPNQITKTSWFSRKSGESEEWMAISCLSTGSVGVVPPRLGTSGRILLEKWNTALRSIRSERWDTNRDVNRQPPNNGPNRTPNPRGGQDGPLQRAPSALALLYDLSNLCAPSALALLHDLATLFAPSALALLYDLSNLCALSALALLCVLCLPYVLNFFLQYRLSRPGV